MSEPKTHPDDLRAAVTEAFADIERIKRALGALFIERNRMEADLTLLCAKTGVPRTRPDTPTTSTPPTPPATTAVVTPINKPEPPKHPPTPKLDAITVIQPEAA